MPFSGKVKSTFRVAVAVGRDHETAQTIASPLVQLHTAIHEDRLLVAEAGPRVRRHAQRQVQQRVECAFCGFLQGAAKLGVEELLRLKAGEEVAHNFLRRLREPDVCCREGVVLGRRALGLLVVLAEATLDEAQCWEDFVGLAFENAVDLLNRLGDHGLVSAAHAGGDALRLGARALRTPTAGRDAGGTVGHRHGGVG